MNRRRFLRCVALSGLWVPAAFAITPQQRAAVFGPRAKAANVSSSPTLKDDLWTGATDNAGAITGDNSIYISAGSFTPSSSYSVSSVSLRTIRVGSSGSAVFTAGIYTNSSGAPNVQLATSTNSKAYLEFSTSTTFYSWTFSGCALTSGTIYWLALISDSLQLGSTYISLRYWDTETHLMKRYNGTTWASLDASSRIIAQIYGT